MKGNGPAPRSLLDLSVCGPSYCIEMSRRCGFVKGGVALSEEVWLVGGGVAYQKRCGLSEEVWFVRGGESLG